MKIAKIINKWVESILNCETTVETCIDCDKVLTEPKTEC